MKKTNITRRDQLFLLLCLLTITLVKGQVVIGSEQLNERAAVLDIKDQVANTENETATQGGLLLPRVALVSSYTLEPMVPTTDEEWINATKKEKLLKDHIGLEVFNVTDNDEVKAGAYVWNGSMWERLFKVPEPKVAKRIVFPLPAFNLPLINSEDIENTRLKINLYDIYLQNRRANNFITNMPNKGDFIVAAIYEADELDYVVTHYDKEIITIHSISNTGIMDYTVLDVNPGPSSFLNIYLVVHEGKEKK